VFGDEVLTLWRGRSMKMLLVVGVVVLALVGSVLSGHLHVPVYCPRAVPPFEVSQTTTFLGICFKESHVGGCDVYTYELPFLRG
jgi:hypothetical protein